MDDRDNLKVGDECYVNDNQGIERKVKVTSRKRKWLIAGGYKFNITHNYEGDYPFGYTPVLHTIKQHDLAHAWNRLHYVAGELADSIGRNTWQCNALSMEEVKALTSQLEALNAQLHDFIKRR